MKRALIEYLNGVEKVAAYIFDEDWTKYAVGIKLYDVTNRRKYLGFHIEIFNTFDNCTTQRTIGILPDIIVSKEILARKFSILKNNPEYKASVQGRNSQISDYGGAVRCSLDSITLIGCTGMPELVDHLVMSTSMRKFELLTQSDYVDVVSYSNSFIQEACQEVVMSEDGYHRLRTYIESLVRKN